MASNGPSSGQPTAGAGLITLHILCPSLPSPNRFTFKYISVSNSVANLKARISEALPSRPRPEDQRLIYRGKCLSDHQARLRDILDQADPAEYTMHLVLPPVPIPATSPSSKLDTWSRGQHHAPIPNDALLSTELSSAHPRTLPSDGSRLQRPEAGFSSRSDEIAALLHQHINIMRQQVEMQTRHSRDPPGPVSVTTTQFTPQHLFQSNESSQNLSDLSHPSLVSIGQLSSAGSEPSSIGHLPPSLAPPNRDGRGGHGDGQLVEDVRLETLRQEIALAEDQLNRGVRPPMEGIVRMRTQLFEILDDLHRNHLSPRDGSVEALLTRVFNVYARADQIRVTGSRTVPSLRPTATVTPSRTSVYLLSSPSGYQALIASPDATQAFQTSVTTIHTQQVPVIGTALASGTAPYLPQQPNAVQLENAVRQAVIDRQLGGDWQFGLIRNVRRLWLFTRLYFLCCMFSDSNSWYRLFLVTLAALASILSETGVPRLLYGSLIAPVQRHLERLVHSGQDATSDSQANGANHQIQHPGNVQSQPNSHTVGPPQVIAGRRLILLRHGWRQNLRRIERSIALFIASLVPGVGERQVEAQNAAQRAREAEIERRRQQEIEQNGTAEGQDPQVTSVPPESTEVQTNEVVGDNAVLPQQAGN